LGDDDLIRYPIGKFNPPETISSRDVKIWLADIEKLPSQVLVAINPLSDAQLDVSYREGGWTIRQIVHHIADSYLNSYIRMKLTLTESIPSVKGFDQTAWGDLADSKNAPVEASLLILEGLHTRWKHLLGALTEAELQKEFFVPSINAKHNLQRGIGACRWHGLHHLRQITSLIERSGWK
jgi:uncharacterized damage-inducible protein DinB